ncbi:PTS sugar transporter subunit IIB [uncultured Traorella sp.]|uniref:PTS sugar transporter subunit IIB n=1 Tax=uncultured Traorella sp. TaxID=1929048 RepID=UPI0025FEC6D0|nr:PTS sugar transporter subunit IIB [uncultured Traorella sp.]
MKKLIVACNAGVATSNTIAYKVKSLLKKRGYEAEVEAVDITSVERALKNADMYICIIKPDKDYGVPMCNGMAFLTGVGIEKELQKIIDVLNK